MNEEKFTPNMHQCNRRRLQREAQYVVRVSDNSENEPSNIIERNAARKEFADRMSALPGEMQGLVFALSMFDGNIKRLADAIGSPRTTIRRSIERLRAIMRESGHKCLV